MLGGCGEKGTLLHCWWECKLVQPLWRTVWRFPKKKQNKTEIELPYDPATPLLGIHTKETRSERDMCTTMFITTLFIDDMILYIENLKDSTRKLLQLINEYSNVAGYKINTQKSPAFLYTNNEKTEREIKETIPFTIATKRIKYLGVYLAKETKDLYVYTRFRV